MPYQKVPVLSYIYYIVFGEEGNGWEQKNTPLQKSDLKRGNKSLEICITIDVFVKNTHTLR